MNDFYDWKRHPITEVVFSALEARMKSLMDEVVDQAATSPQTVLAEKAGAIKAIRDLLDITVEDISE